VLEVSDENTFVRSTYAGNVLTKIKSTQDVNFLTFRTSSFEEIAVGKNNAEVEVVTEKGDNLTEFVK
jgi:electron transfer flavoprotein alpha subunit